MKKCCAHFSADGKRRLLLNRFDWDMLDSDNAVSLLSYAFFGVNPSTAGKDDEDHTTTKWWQFTIRNGGYAYGAANAFDAISTDVKALATMDKPSSAENDDWIDMLIADADVLVPCWGSRLKLPPKLWPRLDWLKHRILSSGKPVKVFGLTKSGDPKHPLMLGYDTPFLDWCG